ncbi:class I SAM-dependent DNA methyltransferase [Roseicella aerolata]|uniref:site-specific DNA-methyltransferase (adenine-specific) n=1 Tax=Roseicella aerolata TaxID=2883479 RepID=A0A9X1IDS8_9PROT|nr:DNA methyltransferase [Roseicella aerolata]MCB4822960.1 class I SAM-dependent DNA methyltransferase [Roseicella aerolata]
MTPDRFIERWGTATLTEAAGAKPHFNDLCELLGVPKPQEDNRGINYAFEKIAAEANGRHGFADVWKRDCFAWEYKRPGADLGAAHLQLLRYAGNLGNPPLLVACDMRRIVVRTAWTNEVTREDTFGLQDLYDPARVDLLRQMWTAPPEAWRPRKTRAALTEEAAGELGELAQRLRFRGHDPQAVAHFVCRLAFCFFAADVKLLPRQLLEGMLNAGRRNPGRFAEYAGTLFAAMAERGSEIGFTAVPWFNGGLFEDAMALPLVAADMSLLDRLSALEWSDIDPSIMGTLFERGLDPSKRGQLGAHYTDRNTIERIVGPVVRRPLQAEWAKARDRIQALLTERAALRAEAGAGAAEDLKALSGAVVTAESVAKRKSLAREAERRRRRDIALLEEAEAILGAYLRRLRQYRVLDPACGSGNFLYVALLTLKDLEGDAIAEAAALGLPGRMCEVGPEAVLGIELNPYAAELARVSVWIGHIQWARRNGYPVPHDPVLRNLDTVECRDAVLATDANGAPVPAAWPAANAIVGNPPFLGDKVMRAGLGDDYTSRLRTAFAGRVPGAADLVCFWFEKAREALTAGTAERVGLVATQSIRNGASRQVLEAIRTTGRIFDAWDDEPWTIEGAAVRVALVCFGRTDSDDVPHLDGVPVAEVRADLTAGGSDLTQARRLAANRGLCLQGPVKVGAFDVPGETARTWLAEPPNPNGRPNTDVLRPWINGQDITRRPSDRWIIDFADMPERQASFYLRPFAHVIVNVKPARDRNRDAQRRERWWRLGRSGGELRAAVAPLSRFIATPRVAKHRLFVWCPATTLPDSRVYAVARDDDCTFGILHSRFHEAWALALASRHGVGNDPTYNNQTCFETFPFPEGLTLDQPASSQSHHPHAAAIAQAARALVEARDRWLNPPEWVEEVAETIPGLPPRRMPRNVKAAVALKARTLTNLYNARGTPDGAWLDLLHADLDAAVAAAYGWPADLTQGDAIARLLTLNLARAGSAIIHGDRADDEDED